MNPERIGTQNTTNTRNKQHRNKTKRVNHNMLFLIEHTGFRKLRSESPIIFRHLRDLEISEIVPSEEFIKVLPSGAGMESDERIGGVLAGEIEERDIATRVLFSPICHIVDLALD
ncbi:hypothetical protein CsSME_00023803 [Camellia sinensis var. sinensis]